MVQSDIPNRLLAVNVNNDPMSLWAKNTLGDLLRGNNEDIKFARSVLAYQKEKVAEFNKVLEEEKIELVDIEFAVHPNEVVVEQLETEISEINCSVSELKLEISKKLHTRRKLESDLEILVAEIKTAQEATIIQIYEKIASKSNSRYAGLRDEISQRVRDYINRDKPGIS